MTHCHGVTGQELRSHARIGYNGYNECAQARTIPCSPSRPTPASSATATCRDTTQTPRPTVRWEIDIMISILSIYNIYRPSTCAPTWTARAWPSTASCVPTARCSTSSTSSATGGSTWTAAWPRASTAWTRTSRRSRRPTTPRVWRVSASPPGTTSRSSPPPTSPATPPHPQTHR